MESVSGHSAFFVLLLLITTYESKAQSQQYAMMITTNSTTIVEGTNFTFQCVTQEEVDQVNVVVDGILAGQGDKFDRIQQDNKASNVTEFTFRNVTSLDQATRLQCYATLPEDSNKSPVSSEVLLCNVGYKPTYHLNASVFHAYKGTTSESFSLPLDSNPYPVDFVWSYDGSVISDPAERNLILSANQITFGTVLTTDEGNYSVEATNLAGSGNASFELVVYYGPNFQEGNNDTQWQEYNNGVNVSLLCSVTGSNPNSVTLSFANDTNSELLNVNVTITDTNINISFTEPSSDNNGFYNCCASNGVATTTFSYWVFFGDDPSGVIVCPTFAMIEGNLVVNLTVTDNSTAPASALSIAATGLLDYQVDINFSQPILPMEAVIVPSVVVVANEAVTASNFTIEVNATNKLTSILNRFSSVFTNLSAPDASCSFPENFTTKTIYISASGASIIPSTMSVTTIPTIPTPTPSNSTNTSTIVSTSLVPSSTPVPPTTSSSPSTTSTAHNVPPETTASPSATAEPSTGSGVGVAVILTICILTLMLLVVAAVVVIYCFWRKRKRRSFVPSDYSEIVEDL